MAPMNLDNIKNIVNQSILNLNNELPKEQKIKISDELSLIGKKSTIDSVIYLNLMLEIEKSLDGSFSLLEEISKDDVIDLTLKDLYLKLFQIYKNNESN